MTSRIETSGRDWGVVKAYDYRNGAHRMQMAALESDEGPDDAAWPPRQRAYGCRPEDIRKRYKRPIRIATKLLLPVILLVTLLGSRLSLHR